MRKCGICGREGTAPDVRGAKSAAVSIGNYRLAVDVDLAICEKCAGKAMQAAVDELIVELVGRAR